MDIVYYLMVYFSRFPSMSAVTANFKRTSGYSNEYDLLKIQIDNLSVRELIPGIKDYVFGSDDEKISERLKACKDVLLFIDFGNIEGVENDRSKEVQQYMNVAVTVGQNGNIKSLDDVEQMLMQNKLLNILQTILNRMIVDRKECAVLNDVIFPRQIVPIPRAELFGIVGWTAFLQVRL